MKFFRIVVLVLAPFCIVFMAVVLFFLSGSYEEKSVKMLCFFGSKNACVAVSKYAQAYEMQNNTQMAEDFYKFACKYGKSCDKLEK